MQVPPELRQSAYTYGKDMVPVTSQDGCYYCTYYAHTMPTDYGARRLAGRGGGEVTYYTYYTYYTDRTRRR